EADRSAEPGVADLFLLRRRSQQPCRPREPEAAFFGRRLAELFALLAPDAARELEAVCGAGGAVVPRCADHRHRAVSGERRGGAEETVSDLFSSALARQPRPFLRPRFGARTRDHERRARSRRIGFVEAGADERPAAVAGQRDGRPERAAPALFFLGQPGELVPELGPGAGAVAGEDERFAGTGPSLAVVGSADERDV